MIKIKAIIFDMDGVLIEAKDWHYEALNRALKLFGMEISRYEHLTTFDGLPTKDKLKILSLDKGLPLSLHNFINELKQQYTMEIVHSLCKPRFYHEYALSRLKNEGYKMAVCSNSIRNSIEVMMKKSALENYLDFYISNEDVKKGKPDPEMYIKAIEKLGLKARECMIVEDNENGIKAAKASGANVMIVNEVDEVNYENIKNHIFKFEKELKC
ncbi:TPA: HAD family phosphatase [Campylobacter jejuni]|nr:HAD family phosphatase [Campylobacter jejuni]